MTRIEYAPQGGKGKVLSVYGFRKSSELLLYIFGMPVKATQRATYYKFRKEDDNKVFEATISEGRESVPRMVITGCSNDAAYLDANMDDVLKKAGMDEAEYYFDDAMKQVILADLEKGFTDFMRETGA